MTVQQAPKDITELNNNTKALNTQTSFYICGLLAGVSQLLPHGRLPLSSSKPHDSSQSALIINLDFDTDALINHVKKTLTVDNPISMGL
jgi:hypothetical protein